MKNRASGSFGIFLIAAVFVGLLGLWTVAWSDMQVTPKGQDGWGDPNEASKMLQMTKTPDAVREGEVTPEERDHMVPRKAHATKSASCTDANGNALDASSSEGQGCSISPVVQPTPRATAGGPNSSGASQGVNLSR